MGDLIVKQAEEAKKLLDIGLSIKEIIEGYGIEYFDQNTAGVWRCALGENKKHILAIWLAEIDHVFSDLHESCEKNGWHPAFLSTSAMLITIYVEKAIEYRYSPKLTAARIHKWIADPRMVPSIKKESTKLVRIRQEIDEENKEEYRNPKWVERMKKANAVLSKEFKFKPM